MIEEVFVLLIYVSVSKPKCTENNHQQMLENNDNIHGGSGMGP